MFITIHSTSNLKSTAKNERDNLARKDNDKKVGFHIVVDEDEVIECIPLNEVAWHATDGYYGAGNRNSIGIEMCEIGDRDKVISNTVQLVAKMLKERNWDINKVKRHYDWYNKKPCPRILNYNNWEGWNKFLKDVIIAMEV